MSDKLRPTEALKEWGDKAEERATNVVVNALPWLESFQCPECNSYCDQTYAYSVDTAAFDGGATPAWECTECDKRYYRGDESELTFDPFDL